MLVQVLVFCHHRAVMDGIARVLTQRGEDFIRIDGQTPSKERHARVQQFQNTAQCRVGVLAITAAGIALTLTAAVLLAALAYYFLGYDQGAVSVFGSDTHIHEFIHDSRHFLGFPCH